MLAYAHNLDNKLVQNASKAVFQRIFKLSTFKIL